MTAAGETGSSVSIALIDIDEFGNVNDEHGHETGDAVLGMVTRRLTEIDVADKTVFRHSFSAAVATFPEDGVRPQDVLLREALYDLLRTYGL